MKKHFIVKKTKKDNKKKELAIKQNKQLRDFYNEEIENNELKTFEEEMFEHLKKHTKKVLEIKK